MIEIDSEEGVIIIMNDYMNNLSPLYFRRNSWKYIYAILSENNSGNISQWPDR